VGSKKGFKIAPSKGFVSINEISPNAKSAYLKVIYQLSFFNSPPQMLLG